MNKLQRHFNSNTPFIFQGNTLRYHWRNESIFSHHHPHPYRPPPPPPLPPTTTPPLPPTTTTPPSQYVRICPFYNRYDSPVKLQLLMCTSDDSYVTMVQLKHLNISQLQWRRTAHVCNNMLKRNKQNTNMKEGYWLVSCVHSGWGGGAWNLSFHP